MFRDLIPLLADRFHLIAPDLPGFGQTDMPKRSVFKYTFDNIADVIDRFTEVVGFDRFAIYVFDYGAPTGFRLAAMHAERITAIISQNGNAYEEGLSEGWNPIRAYWQDSSQANREALRQFLTPETTRWQYVHGVTEESTVSPDGIALDNFYLARPGADEVQLDLFGDYKSNVALYPTFRYSPYGARMTHSSCLQELKPSSVICPMQISAFLTRDTSRWKPTLKRSRQRSATSLDANVQSRELARRKNNPEEVADEVKKTRSGQSLTD
jgi:pimeloyl-ACP methyl ester carboxylesterase